jgi:hypothetical protein
VSTFPGEGHLLDIDLEALAVDRLVQQPGRHDAIPAQGGQDVMVFQWPKGALPGRRAPLGAQPRRGAMLVLVQVSSIKTRREGSILG